MNDKTSKGVRLDKWLWAARFFKTRGLAKAAIEGGKVHCNGVRGKSSKSVQVDDSLSIRVGFDEKVVIVQALSEHRRGAPEAQLLYAETAESIKKREEITLQRKLVKGNSPATAGRPTKKQRRDIQQLHQLDFSQGDED